MVLFVLFFQSTAGLQSARWSAFFEHNLTTFIGDAVRSAGGPHTATRVKAPYRLRDIYKTCVFSVDFSYFWVMKRSTQLYFVKESKKDARRTSLKAFTNDREYTPPRVFECLASHLCSCMRSKVVINCWTYFNRGARAQRWSVLLLPSQDQHLRWLTIVRAATFRCGSRSSKKGRRMLLAKLVGSKKSFNHALSCARLGLQSRIESRMLTVTSVQNYIVFGDENVFVLYPNVFVILQYRPYYCIKHKECRFLLIVLSKKLIWFWTLTIRRNILNSLQ